MPFRPVVEMLAFFTRVRVGRETVRRLTEGAGATEEAVETGELERLERERPVPPEGPAVQQMSADGAMVPLVRGEWAEVRTLSIGEVERRGTGEVHAKEVSYFSRMVDAESFGRLALLETHRRGTEHAAKVCAVMDGAEWLQTLVDLHRPDAVRILDFPHAAEHLSRAAQAVWGEGDQRARGWLKAELHELKHGDPGRVIEAVRRLPAEQAVSPEGAADIRDGVVQYLEKRRKQIQYARFQAQGYPIGSGMAESANKLVVEARLKGSGMRWARANVDPMLALRSAACSDRWDEAWESVWCMRLRRLEERRHARCANRHKALLPAIEAQERPKTPSPTPERPVQPRPVRTGRPSANHPWRRPFLPYPLPLTAKT